MTDHDHTDSPADDLDMPDTPDAEHAMEEAGEEASEQVLENMDTTEEVAGAARSSFKAADAIGDMAHKAQKGQLNALNGTAGVLSATEHTLEGVESVAKMLGADKEVTEGLATAAKVAKALETGVEAIEGFVEIINHGGGDHSGGGHGGGDHGGQHDDGEHSAAAQALEGDEAGGRVQYEFACEALEQTYQITSFHMVEELNKPYRIEVELIAQEEDTDSGEFLGQDAEILLRRRQQSRRVYGIVSRVQDLGPDPERRTRCKLTIGPALGELSLGSASRIFQNKSAVEILEDVLQERLSANEREHDLSGLDASAYPTREYCVQYRESDLDFCHRLMEEEGIGYYFDFDGDQEGSGSSDQTKEKLVAFDANQSLPRVESFGENAVPFSVARRETAGREHVHGFTATDRTLANSLYVRDQDWTHEDPQIIGDFSEPDRLGRYREQHDHGLGRTLNIYDYQEGSRRYAQNDLDPQLQRRMQAMIRDRRVCEGVGQVVDFAPGRIFELTGHPGLGADGRYLIVGVEHCPADQEGESEDYENRFWCIPSDVPYRPQRVTPKQAIYGVQSAKVSGPQEGQIFTDEHGRIKVRFHWDASDTADDRASCWIRVSQVWAGHDGLGHPGFLFIPRVGMEVLVTFLDGNPDRPLCTGSVYNGKNATPGSLPDEASRSIIRTRSLGGEGFNELSFEDELGGEEVYLRAERNLRELVQHNHDTHVQANQTNTVDVDQTETVHHDQTMTIGNCRTKDVASMETNHIGGERHTTIDGNDKLFVGESVETALETYVTGHEKREVGAGRETTITGHEHLLVTEGASIDITGFRLEALRDSAETNVTGNQVINVTGHHHVNHGDGSAQMMLEEHFAVNTNNSYIRLTHGGGRFEIKDSGVVEIVGRPSLELKVGLSSIKLTASGIEIKGPSVKIEATGGNVDVNASGQVKLKC